MKTIKKYSTGISGLDTLFHGGIQIEDFQNGSSPKDDNGLLIALKGAKGCNKTLLAMQLMQGLLGDFYDKNPDTTLDTTFISLNKSESDLSDMYYDVFISKLLNDLSSIYVRGKSKASVINDLILEIFEKPQIVNENNAKYYELNLIECISNRVIYYNTRTNGLHYRRVQEYAERGYISGCYGDDTDNILYRRKDVTELCKVKPSLESIEGLSTTYLKKMFNVKYEQCSQNALVYVQKIINKLY